MLVTVVKTIETFHRIFYTSDIFDVAVRVANQSSLPYSESYLREYSTHPTFLMWLFLSKTGIFYTSDISDVAVLEQNRNCFHRRFYPSGET